MMVRFDQQFLSLNNNERLDHVTLPSERTNKINFLHDNLEGKIYMERPKGYTDSLLTCKLRNPFYGLKKGPRAWHPKFNSSILSKRFEICKIGCKSNNISSPIWHHIGRRWRGSHALYQRTSAHKDHHTTLLLYKGAK